MSHSIIKYLAAEPTMQVIRGLLQNSKPRHLRDLAASYGISPAGVSDIIRRLNAAGVLRETYIGNRRCFSLAIGPLEHECLKSFFSIYEITLLQARALRFSKTAPSRLQRMDEAYNFYRRVKKLKHDPT